MESQLQQLPPPAIGVGAIVFDGKNRVLLIRRGQEPALGQWSVPGGKHEAGETLVAACRREVLEETGIAIDLQSIIAVVERITDGFHYLIVDFIAFPVDSAEQLPVASSDVTDAEWIALDKLSEYDLVEGLKTIILRAKQDADANVSQGLADIYGTGRDFFPLTK